MQHWNGAASNQLRNSWVCLGNVHPRTVRMAKAVAREPQTAESNVHQSREPRQTRSPASGMNSRITDFAAVRMPDLANAPSRWHRRCSLISTRYLGQILWPLPGTFNCPYAPTFAAWSSSMFRLAGGTSANKGFRTLRHCRTGEQCVFQHRVGLLSQHCDVDGTPSPLLPPAQMRYSEFLMATKQRRDLC